MGIARQIGRNLTAPPGRRTPAGTPAAKTGAAPLSQVQRHPSLAKFFFGYLAGLFSETAIYPLDTVRRRQQALGDATPLSRMSSFRALVHLAQHEGVAGMYKGLLLNLIKNPIATAVSFAVNDMVRRHRDAHPSLAGSLASSTGSTTAVLCAGQGEAQQARCEARLRRVLVHALAQALSSITGLAGGSRC